MTVDSLEAKGKQLFEQARDDLALKAAEAEVMSSLQSYTVLLQACKKAVNLYRQAADVYTKEMRNGPAKLLEKQAVEEAKATKQATARASKATASPRAADPIQPVFSSAMPAAKQHYQLSCFSVDAREGAEGAMAKWDFTKPVIIRSTPLVVDIFKASFGLFCGVLRQSEKDFREAGLEKTGGRGKKDLILPVGDARAQAASFQSRLQELVGVVPGNGFVSWTEALGSASGSKMAALSAFACTKGMRYCGGEVHDIGSIRMA